MNILHFPLLVEPASDWKELALCAETDPEQFFPEKGQPSRHAKSVCARCSVRMKCLEEALDTREPWGIWGGLTLRERQQIIRDREQASA